MRRNGFSLLEVIMALAIALIMLTALYSLQIKSATLGARAIRGFDALPLAIERIENLTKIDFSGKDMEFVGDYEVVTTAREDMTADIPVTRIHVEVLQNGEIQNELSLFKFKLQ